MQQMTAVVMLNREVESPLELSDLAIVAREDIEAQLEGLRTMGWLIDLTVEIRQEDGKHYHG